MTTKTEKHAHVCPICERSFMGKKDYFKICPECVRKHNIDLLAQDLANEADKQLVQRLKETSDKTLAELEKRHLRFMEKYLRHRKRNRIWIIGYTIVVILWAIIIYLDNFVWK